MYSIECTAGTSVLYIIHWPCYASLAVCMPRVIDDVSAGNFRQGQCTPRFADWQLSGPGLVD